MQKERTKYKARAGPLSVPTTGGRSSGEEDNDVVVGSVGSGRRPSAIARAVTAQSTGVTTPGGIDSTLRHNSSPLRQVRVPLHCTVGSLEREKQMLQLHRENTIQRSNTGSCIRQSLFFISISLYNSLSTTRRCGISLGREEARHGDQVQHLIQAYIPRRGKVKFLVFIFILTQKTSLEGRSCQV